MRVALCLSGHARTHEKTHPFWKKHLMSHHKVDVFIHMWNSKGTKINSKYSTELSTPGVEEKSDVDINRIINLWKPTVIAVENYSAMHQKFVSDITPLLNAIKKLKFSNNQLFMPLSARSMMYKRFLCNELKILHEQLTNCKYEIVIQTRFDVAIGRPLPDTIINNPNSLYLNDTRNTTTFPPDISINDYTTIGSSAHIDSWCSFFNFFTEILKLPIYNEKQLKSILDHHMLYRNFLEITRCPFNQIKLGAVIVREDGNIEGTAEDIANIKNQLEKI